MAKWYDSSAKKNPLTSGFKQTFGTGPYVAKRLPPPVPKPSTPAKKPTASGMDIVRSSAESPTARPSVPRRGPSGPKSDPFGQPYKRTSPFGAATATQRTSPSSLGKTLSTLRSAVSSGVAAIDRDLRATVMKPRSPVRTPSPRRSPVVPTQPTAAGPQAVNPSNRPNIGRAADQYRRNARPAQFGTVGESPMNKAGMLNIPRAGKKLAGMVGGSELPKPPGYKEPKPKSPPKVKAPKAVKEPKPPRPKVTPVASQPEKVAMPKPPKNVKPPKPKAAPPAPPAPSKPKKQAAPKVLGQRGGVSIVHEGGRNVLVKHEGGAKFYVPYNPAKKGKISQAGVEKTLSSLAEPAPRKQPVFRFDPDNPKQVEKMDKMFGTIKDPERRKRAFIQNEQKRLESRARQSEQKLQTKYKGDESLRRVTNLGGRGQIAIAKNLGLMGLGAVGMAPSIIRLARGASLGSLAGPVPQQFSKGTLGPTYTVRDKKTGKTYKMGGSWS